MKYAGTIRQYDYRANVTNENCNEHQHENMPNNGGIYVDNSDIPLAMAIIPFQKWGPLFELEKGFDIGTIFPELDFPFTRYGQEGR